jgi:predicted enzyme related to lactoylglutathione lyase
MIKSVESILLASPNAKKLAGFYRDTVGLKVTMEAEMGENKEMVFGFSLKGGSDFVIVDHSQVKDKNNKPQRYIINFEVDDIEKEVKRMKKTSTKLITDIYHIENYGQIATFEDIDGNYFQFVQVRPTPN